MSTLLKSQLLYLLYHTIIQTLVNRVGKPRTRQALTFPYGGPKLPHLIKVGHRSSHVNYVHHVNNLVVST